MDISDDSDDWDDSPPVWESQAERAVEEAWSGAAWDEVRGVIEISDPDDPRRSRECKDLDELQSALAEIYVNEWHGHVPYDSGSAVFEEDGRGYVGDLLSGEPEVEEFFSGLKAEDSEELLYGSDEEVERGESETIRIDLSEINDELIDHLSRNPQLMRELNPRKFEILIAELFRKRGYEVQITPATRDGGRDIVIFKKHNVGTGMTLIECKRHAERNKVGIGIVQRLYGVVCAESDDAKGLVATTSSFTKDAQKFQKKERVECRLTLADFGVLSTMLRQFSKR